MDPLNPDNASPLQENLHVNLKAVQNALGASPDLILKEIFLSDGVMTAIVYIDGLVDLKGLHNSIIQNLMSCKAHPQDVCNGRTLLDFIRNDILMAGDIGIINDQNTLLTCLLSGDAILLVNGCTECLRIGVSGWESRSVSEPITQTVVRGPMEAFNENLRTNTALLRRKIKDPHLWLEQRYIGKVTQTTVAIMYLKNVAADSIVKEVRSRLDQINIDGILESGYIEELIQDKTLSPFATIYNSERPDTIAAGILEGRVAILIDGTPFALLVPALFIQFFQSAEDYAQRSDVSTLLRIIRFLSFFISLLAPSLYIAITTFHQEMLPTNLLINLAAQRDGVPFPAFFEALMMEITYEILREAGVRMPRTVGQAVSIVGTLVIGQAAVEAGIVSSVMVIIVSITAISSYVIPATSMSISVRMLRFLLMGLAASFGLFGILMGIIVLVLHLSSLRSFGVPYMSPLSPMNLKGQKDTFFRIPWQDMLTRPPLLAQKNNTRQKSGKKQGK
ncbi:spore germination protein [Paenibacillus nasutitermitis]|uniref:Spore germination protein n=1 Tax=Paenibacillus nasutitermitis TaxID=1652958 RepID=A0A917DWC8_9BACL|nr:spore germination protein [Paenibacillus nasutitermitis]GGD76526.1 spore germination protein [Paenibacillus nasutitermitis]